MHWIDWTILAAYLIWIVWDGLRLTKRAGELEGYFLASRSIPWWAVGLSVMATQLSAITMIGTTGQGYLDGMRFIQLDRKSTRLNSSHANISYAVFCLKKKKGTPATREGHIESGRYADHNAGSGER